MRAMKGAAKLASRDDAQEFGATPDALLEAAERLTQTYALVLSSVEDPAAAEASQKGFESFVERLRIASAESGPEDAQPDRQSPSERVAGATSELPPSEHSALLLLLNGADLPKISAQLGVSETAVRSLLRQTFAHLSEAAADAPQLDR